MVDHLDKFISREEICEELRIDEETLHHYERYAELPTLSEEGHHITVAKFLGKVHDLHANHGLTLQEIKHLSFFADQYKELIPALGVYADLSPKSNMEKALFQYKSLVKDLQDREAKLKEKIHELQDTIENSDFYLEENNILKSRLEKADEAIEAYKREIHAREEQVIELQSEIAQLEFRQDDINYQSAMKDSQIAKLQSKLYGDGQVPEEQETLPKAVNLEQLLKRKEKEITLKHQKQVLELRKQVEVLLAQKEQEWQKNMEHAQ